MRRHRQHQQLHLRVVLRPKRLQLRRIRRTLHQQLLLVHQVRLPLTLLPPLHARVRLRLQRKLPRNVHRVHHKVDVQRNRNPQRNHAPLLHKARNHPPAADKHHTVQRNARPATHPSRSLAISLGGPAFIPHSSGLIPASSEQSWRGHLSSEQSWSGPHTTQQRLFASSAARCRSIFERASASARASASLSARASASAHASASARASASVRARTRAAVSSGNSPCTFLSRTSSACTFLSTPKTMSSSRRGKAHDKTQGSP